jgi:hypothetical protein
MKEPVELQDDAARMLRLLARAPLPEGMEARLTAELRGRQRALAQRAAASAGLRLPGMFVLAGLALVLIAALLVNLRRSEQVQTGQSASNSEPRSTAVQPAALPKAAPHLMRARRSMPRATGRLGMEQHEPAQVTPEFLNPPPLPLSAQERLLLELARSRALERAPALILSSEVVVNHGVGRNAIFELDHQNPSPLQSTLQTSPIQGDLE